MKRPMILAAIFSAVVSLTVINSGIIVDILIAAAVLILLILSAFFRKFRFMIAVFFITLVILLNSIFIKSNIIKRVEAIDTETPLTVSGLVVSEYYKDNAAIYTLKTDENNEMLPKNIKISVYTKFASLTTGERVKCKMYINPIDDEAKAARYSVGVYAYATISKVLESKETTSLTGVLSNFRSRVTSVLFKHLSYDSAASVNAITVGDRYYLDPSFETLVKRSGVSHVMVVSGMHMAIICGSFLKLLKKLKFGNKISAVITGVFVFLFMALCGFSMSVMRAGITYFIILLGQFLVRRSDPLNSLCIAVCFIAMLNPFSVNSVAFQLSVMSTAGIIILSTPIFESITKFLHIKLKPIKFIIEMISVTLSALIFTFPLTVYYFGGVSTVAIFTNLLIAQAVSAALILASISLPIALITNFVYIPNGLFFFCELITRYFNGVIEYFGSLHWAYIEVNKGVTIICYLAIILSFVIIKYIEQIKRVVKSGVDSIRTATEGKSK